MWYNIVVSRNEVDSDGQSFRRICRCCLSGLVSYLNYLFFRRKGDFLCSRDVEMPQSVYIRLTSRKKVNKERCYEVRDDARRKKTLVVRRDKNRYVQLVIHQVD